MSRFEVAVIAESWFDGIRLHPDPVTIAVDAGRIVAVLPGRRTGLAVQEQACAFAAPGLVEAHCHLFLDGGLVDQELRNRHLEAGEAAWLATGRENLERLRSCGITLVRDAGDRHGINHRLRAEAAQPGSLLPRIRSPGQALRRKGRYGSFMAQEIAGIQDISAAIAAHRDCDDLKIVLTGIIDFAAGVVKGAPQFDRAELTAIVAQAHAAGLRTFAHCSGADGIALLLDGGVDSVEHGFFMTEDALSRMAVQGTTWVPTWSPVACMAERPDLLGLDAASVSGLQAILANHRRCLTLAARLGVRLVAGSDAGSCGVVHGPALLAELEAMLAAGVPLETVLASATSVPRRSWGVEGGRIAVGEPADLAGWPDSPLGGLAHLRQATLVLMQGRLWQPQDRLAVLPG